MLSQVKAEIRKERDAEVLFEASHRSAGAEAIKSAFLDQVGTEVLGAEDDEKIKHLVDSLPEYDDGDEAIAKELATESYMETLTEGLESVEEGFKKRVSNMTKSFKGLTFSEKVLATLGGVIISQMALNDLYTPKDANSRAVGMKLSEDFTKYKAMVNAAKTKDEYEAAIRELTSLISKMEATRGKLANDTNSTSQIVIKRRALFIDQTIDEFEGLKKKAQKRQQAVIEGVDLDFLEIFDGEE